MLPTEKSAATVSVNASPVYHFVQQPNPVSGKLEWKAQSEDQYDYFRDVARSSFADMLHDSERNKLYYKAIQIAVEKMKKHGKRANVLDIGTGTGLLSMMAAAAGADSITAIEVFKPMAEVAKLITKVNGFEHIKVINKHSTEVNVGPEEDMTDKANILVTELFDTELIGEGALKAYQHAHANLVEEDCIAVPHLATVFVQIVESEMMWSWHALDPIRVENKWGENSHILPDPKMKECPGVPAVHDIQLSQVKRTHFTPLTDPVEVFTFEWGSKSLTTRPRSNVVGTEATSTGRAQVALSWWTLNMDQEGSIILSTAPYWCHPSPCNMQWRDHWIQSVYFLPKAFDVSEGDAVSISAHHDAYCMWFEAKAGNSEDGARIPSPRPLCEYLPRMLWSRPRLGMLNDRQRNQTFVDALNAVKFGQSTKDIAICVSDVSILPLLVAKTCFTKGQVYFLENDRIGRNGLQSLIKHNGRSDSITALDEPSDYGGSKRTNGRPLKLFVGEPFFTSSLLPWHDLRFWYARTEMGQWLSPDAQIMPCRARLLMAAVQFEDLWKIRAPVGTVEGFDVSIMDEMISAAMMMQEYHEPEPHSLWEYPCRLLSRPKEVFCFDMTKPVPEHNICSQGSFSLDCGGQSHFHAVVLWMVYDLDDHHTLSTGLVREEEGTAVWDMHHKQGVFFLCNPIMQITGTGYAVDYDMAFHSSSGEMTMKFSTSRKQGLLQSNGT